MELEQFSVMPTESDVVKKLIRLQAVLAALQLKNNYLNRCRNGQRYDRLDRQYYDKYHYGFY